MRTRFVGLSQKVVTLRADLRSDSEGGRGSDWLYSRWNCCISVTTQVEVADTIGAGDTFLAAALTFLHQENVLYQREKLRDLSEDQMTNCLAYANQAAAINCSRRGADPPYAHEMENSAN